MRKRCFFSPGFRHLEDKMFKENCFKLFYFFFYTQKYLLKNVFFPLGFKHAREIIDRLVNLILMKAVLYNYNSGVAPTNCGGRQITPNVNFDKRFL